MVRATWNGAVLAESDDTVIVEGNHYFPPETLNRAKAATTRCARGGARRATTTSSWTRRSTGPQRGTTPIPDRLEAICRRVAFRHGVRVEADGDDARPLARLRRRLTG
jgi:hypothetical protein